MWKPRHTYSRHQDRDQTASPRLKWLVLVAGAGLFFAPGAFALDTSPQLNPAPGSQSSRAGQASASASAGRQAAAAVHSNTRQASSWQTWLAQLKRRVENQPAVAAEHARSKAAEANLAAQEGDLNLKLTAGYTYYPNGAGIGENGSFTNLKQRGNIRLGWGVLGFFARRPGRIEQAQATAQQQQYDSQVARLQTEKLLLSEQIADWAAARKRKALKYGLKYARDSKNKLHAAHHSSLATLTGATAQRVTTTLSVYRQIQTRLAALPSGTSSATAIPVDYARLPASLPAAATIQKLSRTSPQISSLKAQSRAQTGKARSLWGRGVGVNVFGGYISEKRKGATEFQSGPEVGVRLTVPIGSSAAHEKSAAEWKAKAKQRDAKAAAIRQSRRLQLLRQQMAGDKAGLGAAKTALKRRAKLLKISNTRAQHPASGKAPEPWALDLERARFWVGVADVWNQRQAYVEDVLTWALYDPTYLQRAGTAAPSGAADPLCAPLTSCQAARS